MLTSAAGMLRSKGNHTLPCYVPVLVIVFTAEYAVGSDVVLDELTRLLILALP